MNDQKNNHPPPESKNHDKPWPTLEIDYELYEQILEDSDASDEEKRAFADAIWAVAVAFASFRFGVHPVQQVCEGSDAELSRQLSKHLLDSTDSPITKPLSPTFENTQSLVNERDKP